MMNLLINIHGFLSSHKSDKVVELRDYIEQKYTDIQFISPCLPDRPADAVRLVEEIIKKQSEFFDAVGIIGHSLGGYFATYIASKNKIKAVLVNPVIRGYEIMCEFYGECYNPHTDTKFSINDRDIEFLISINSEPIRDKSLFLVMLQLGDEIVDAQAVLSCYTGCSIIIEKGGCHDFAGLVNHADSIVDFLFLKKA